MAQFAIAAAPWALGGLSAVTSGVGALAEYQTGQYQSEVARRTAESQKIQAQQIQQQAGQQIIADDYKSSHLLSSIITKTAASGVTEEGSPSTVFADSADQARLNDMYTQYAANVQSTALKYQADITEASGREAAGAATIGALTEGIGGTVSAGIETYGLKQKVSPYDFYNYGNF